jgi:CPA2 family monovalent cation:H+ antiporter-2
VSADQFLAQVVTVLGAAVLVVVVSVRLRAPSIVGLILAGMLIGPTGLGLVHETELVEILAEIGVVLLLFLIGLELSVSRLRELARPFLLGGGSQAVLTMAGGFVLAMSWSIAIPAMFEGLPTPTNPRSNAVAASLAPSTTMIGYSESGRGEPVE